jgi:NADH-quinone oxidoreductase subunit E
MVWLATQMWILLALSLLLGLFVGWWIWHRPPRRVDDDADRELAKLRSRIEETEAEKNKLRAQLFTFEAAQESHTPDLFESDTEPLFYETASDGNPDDLKCIKGIGPQLEKILQDMGVFYYHQIAAWTDGQVNMIDEKLRFKGRIVRDNWRAQASALASKR